MRDGLILFMDGSSATYKRIGERCAEFEILDNKEKIEEAIEEYKSKR